jgi:hypothetical protein
MNRLVIVAKLKEGSQEAAEELIRQGPPFEPGELGFERHSVYVSPYDVVFLFEAPGVEWIVDNIVDDPVLSTALTPWYGLVDGPARLAHERYHWSSGEHTATVTPEQG